MPGKAKMPKQKKPKNNRRVIDKETWRKVARKTRKRGLR